MSRHRFAKQALSLLLVLVMVVSFTLSAMATDVYYAVDTDGKQYNNVAAAWTAAKSGAVITMLRDWGLGSRLILEAGKSATIYMNGHKIERNLSDSEGNGEVILLEKGSNLTLLGYSGPDSTTKTWVDIPYKPWSGDSRYSSYIKTGGLITGGYSTNGAGGIHMKQGSTLTLDHVAVSGNYSDTNWLGQNGYGGAIMMNGESTALIMKNNAVISYNTAVDDGGGVYINNSKGTVTMIESSINYNYAGRDGGGIYGDSTNHLIYMYDGSEVIGNSAEEGGGIYLSDTDFVIRGDGKSDISYNKARDGHGGAIYIDSQPGSNSGIIHGLNMRYNTASNYGGAIYLHQESTSVSNCTIAGNRAYEGAGIYNNNDKNTLSGCTITDNVATHEGGGVYSSCQNDITLGGTMYIENNRRTDGAKDDLFLNDTTTYSAYLLGSPSAKSRVGIRTAEKLRRVGKYAYFNESAFFSDFDNAHIEYRASSNELWVVSGAAASTVTATQVSASEKTTVGTFNGQPVVRGYFSYASVGDTALDLDSNYYYSDGYFLFGQDSYCVAWTDADGRGDPREYNPHLASMSMAMALAGFYSNIGNDGEFDSQSQYDLTYTYKSQNIEKLLTDIGVEPDDIYISDTYAVKPGTYTIGVAIGKKEIENGDSTSTLVPIVVRSAGYESEWTSNVTVGISGEHEGFANAADQVFAQVQNYISTYGLEDEVQAGKLKFWIMGYSRGGATSNLTAKRLVEAYCDGTSDAMNNQVYAYCFEAPQGGRNSEMKLDESKYYCIHNCINRADLVPEVAPKEMGFMRYGVDHYVPGEATATQTPSTDTFVWHYVKNQDWASSYKSWFDNKSYEVGSTQYNEQRAKMLAQLASVDPENTDFCDYFTISELDYITYPLVSTSDLSPDGAAITQEQFIHIFIRALLSWGLNGSGGDLRSRYYNQYSTEGVQFQSFEEALRAVVPIVFGKTAEDLEGIMNGVMAGYNSLGFFTMIEYYDQILLKWFVLTQKQKGQYCQELWDLLINTQGADGKSASDYLTSNEYKQLHAVWYTLLDTLMRFVNTDYGTGVSSWGEAEDMSGAKTNLVEGYTGRQLGYGGDWQAILGTLLRNTTALAQGHYPEVNFAWLRSYDEYYQNDGNQPVVIETDGHTEVPSVSGQSSSDGILTLDTEIEGAALFFRVKASGSETYSDWKPYNLPVDLALFREEGDTTSVDFSVQITAVYCGKTSGVRTIAAGIWKAKAYTVYVNNEALGAFKAGSTVTIDGTATDAAKAFRMWAASAGISLSDLENANSAVTTFTMPMHDVAIFAEYADRIANVTLTVDTPQAGQQMPTEGTLSWGNTSIQVELFWLENLDDSTPYAGSVAGYGKKYSVVAVANQNPAEGIVFVSDMSKESVTVQYAGYEAQNAYYAYVDAAGALRIFGGQIETSKPKVTSIPNYAISLVAGSGGSAVSAKLPTRTMVITEAGLMFVDLDPANADMSGALNEDGTIKDGGIVKLPLAASASELLDNPASDPIYMTVRVYVSASKVADAPVASVTTTADSDVQAAALFTEPVQSVALRANLLPGTAASTAVAGAAGTRRVNRVSAQPVVFDVATAGTYNQTSLTVTLNSTTAGAVIKYTVNGGEEMTYTGPFTLTGAEGEKTYYIVTSWAEADNYGRSSETVQTYVLDNPFTVTIHGKDTGVKGAMGEELWTKSYRYYKGQTVKIAAPAEQDEIFDRWESVPAGVEGTETGTALMVNMTGNVELTAIYNPVVCKLELTLDAPVFGKKLPTKVTAAYATVTDRYQLTEYFADIQWTPAPESTVADSGTVYTAKLTLKTDGTASGNAVFKYYLSENLELVVNGGDSRIKASVAKENTAVYVTFPATAEKLDEEVTVVGIDKPVSVGISREDAAAGNWGLPQQATLILSAGRKMQADITWATPTPAYDATMEGAQMLTATGTVTIPDTVTLGSLSNVITVTIFIAPANEQVRMPAASLFSGTYTGRQYVRLSSVTDGTAIYYTLDGTEPTEQSTLYGGGAILIAETATLRMVAIKDGVKSSEATYNYTIEPGDESDPETDTESEPATATDTEPDTDTVTTVTETVSGSESNVQSVTATGSEIGTDVQSGKGCRSAAEGAGVLVVLVLACAAAVVLNRKKQTQN